LPAACAKGRLIDSDRPFFWSYDMPVTNHHTKAISVHLDRKVVLMSFRGTDGIAMNRFDIRLNALPF
jgi:hypothetical protein